MFTYLYIIKQTDIRYIDMIELFLKDIQPGMYRGLITYPYLRFVIDRIRSDLNKVLDYYSTVRIRAINNANMLCRLVDTLQPSLDLDISTYFKYVDSQREYVGKRFGIVSNINKGYSNLDVLQDGASELYLSVEHGVDLLDISKNWASIQPIRLIFDNLTSLDMNLPYYQIKSSTKEDLYVYEIDINLLLLKYRGWSKYHLARGDGNNVEQYIATQVIPFILPSMLDRHIWNRFKNIYYGKDVDMYVNEQPFYLSDYSPKIDSVLKDIAKNYQDGKYPITRIVNTIPTLVEDEMLKALRLSNNLYTTQSLWIAWLARLDDMEFLMDVIGDNFSRNKAWVAGSKYDLDLLLHRSSTLPNNMPNSIKTRFLGTLAKLSDRIS